MSEEEISKNENDRQYRLIDQGLSMHSILRDRYARRATLLNCGLIGTSIFLCAFAFACDQAFTVIGVSPEIAKSALGFLSVVVLILSIIEFRVGWEGKASLHLEATQHLGELKLKYRKAWTENQGNDTKQNGRLSREYEKLQSLLPPIPENKFLSLKKEHEFKRLLSQRVSQHTKTPLWFLRLQMQWEGIREAMGRGKASRQQ